MFEEQAGKQRLVMARGRDIWFNGGELLFNGKVCNIARGQHTTLAAADTIQTGLAQVYVVLAQMESDPGDDPLFATGHVGDQAGTPASGSIIIKTWKTNGTDPTPAAATTFSKVVNWLAIGVPYV